MNPHRQLSFAFLPLSCLILVFAPAALLQAQPPGGEPPAAPGASGGGGKPRNFVAERAQVEKSWKLLGQKWQRFAQAQAPGAPPKAALAAPPAQPGKLSLPQLEKAELEAKTPAPQRESLARTTRNGYFDPPELRSRDGVLQAVLVATYARNFIGSDPVYLRSYNGQLVGPTLRVKPGDTLRVTVRNDLPTQPWQKDSMNTLHDFNTTNLHTHGLHVSPNGISDNVLIEIGPQSSQNYEIVIPKDHPCGSFWYHAHHHGSTAGNVASGMSGALIIEGGLDDIPEIKAAKERVMVLNQIPYLYKNTLDDGNGGTITFDFPEGIIEEKIAGYIFGPGDWSTLGRYTTVNGIQLPVIRMRPGQIERWRVTDSGQREEIDLQLTNIDGTSPGIPFHEIALDGLALGKCVTKDIVQLLPGYRSDVLVQAPDKEGEFLLVDQSSAVGLNGDGEPLKYIARVVVEGAPVSMKLPTEAQMAPFRLPTLMNATVDLQQSAVYGILPAAGGVVFTIDGNAFSMDSAKELLLGNTDEWSVSVRNGGGINTGHPFHIHVNPFEVFSIMGPQDPKNPASPQVEQLTGGPVWRDTIWVPNNGTVKFRTQYTDFIGTFVQHCHILDHEDQGMMQLIDIRDPKAPLAAAEPAPTHPVPEEGAPAPAFSRPDAAGQARSGAALAGQNRVIFLFKGHGCLHCSRQVREFTELHEQFKARGIAVLGISSDSVEDLKAALQETPCPFPILADPEGQAFAAFGCVRSNGLAHGTFLIDASDRVVWRNTGSSPWLGISRLLEGRPDNSTASAASASASASAGAQPGS